MTERITPTAAFHVLAHLGIPRIDAAEWRLEVAGLVRRPLTLTFEDLRALPKRELAAFHQCAGNPLEPTLPTRRIGNVVWGGADLATVLDMAEPRPEAAFMWSYGADHGEFAGEHQDAYVKDLPLARIREGDVLLAYELNGSALPAEHGHPVRLLVPGWYGTNSVKWLTRLELAGQRAGGLFTTKLYNDPVPPTPDDPSPAPRPVWAVPVESVLVSPAPDASLVAGAPVEVWGWAWGAAGVCRAEVSLDAGASWAEAELEPRVGHAWQRFSLVVPAPTRAGPATLCARATSADGHVQPLAGARNAVHAVAVRVVQASPAPRA